MSHYPLNVGGVTRGGHDSGPKVITAACAAVAAGDADTASSGVCIVSIFRYACTNQ